MIVWNYLTAGSLLRRCAVAGLVTAGACLPACGSRTALLDARGAAGGGAACIAGGGTVTLASAQDSPSNLVVDSANAYWLSGSNVMAVSLCGGTPVTLASGQEPTGLAVDATSVYWANADDDAGNYTTLTRVAKDGSALTVMATFEDLTLSPAAPGATTVVVGANAVYLAGYLMCESVDGGPCSGTEIIGVPLDGGIPMTLAHQQGSTGALSVNATDVFWPDCGNDINSPYDSMIVSTPLAGGATGTLATGQGEPGFIVASDESVYWWNTIGGNVCAVPVAGGSTTTLVSGELVLTGIAIDTTNLYWITAAPLGSVQTVPLVGGTPTTVVATPDAYTSIVVDATSLYWTDASNVVRLTPK